MNRKNLIVSGLVFLLMGNIALAQEYPTIKPVKITRCFTSNSFEITLITGQ